MLVPQEACAQMRGLVPLLVVGDGCRAGDALFLLPYALLVSKLVALELKPPHGMRGLSSSIGLPPPWSSCSCQTCLPVPAAKQRSGTSWYQRGLWGEEGCVAR